MRSLISFFVLLLVAAVQAISSAGDRVLVVLDDVAEKATYSKFLGDLEGRGYKIAYETPKSEDLKLFQLGERSYDHIIFFPSKSKGLGPNLTPNLILQHINANGNVLVALSSSTPASSSIISVLSELDIGLPTDRTGLVVDHFNYDTVSASEKHNVLVLPTPGNLRPDTVDFFSPESKNGEVIAFPNGVGQTLGSGALLSPILRAPATAYSYNPKEQTEALDDLFAAGKQLSLVSALQARNSARFTVVGSADLLSDKWFDAKVKKVGDKKEVATVNREFAKRVAAWTFKELGVLRVNRVEHHLNEDAPDANVTNPKQYRIKNDVSYSISLSAYSWDKWVPFTLPAGDELQLEFSMLSPFHRLPLVSSLSTDDSTTYSVNFKLPDQHGIYNFLVNYKRPFFSNVEEKTTVTVRQFAHDEFRRSWVISSAWPYVTSLGVTIAGWVAFVGIWLYSKPVKAGETKKTQ